jgi:glycosyltransferase involved in cell wall biosynthesis
VKIAILCGHYPYSGAGAIAYESARELSGRHSVSFIHGGIEDAKRWDGSLQVVSLRLPERSERKGRHLYWNPGMIRKLKGALKEMAPDVVHFHIIQRQSFSLASLLLSRRYRSVWTLHDQWHLCMRSVPEPPHCEGMRRFCLFCSSWPGLSVANKLLKEAVYAASPLEVVVPSRWLAELTGYSMLGRKRVHLVYNGIDLDLFHPALEECRDASTSTTTLLFVSGPNDPTKGIGELLRAFQLLRFRNPQLRLKVVGDPPPGTELVPGVEVMGRLSRDRMAEEYRGSDLFVLPTLADNTPVTLMEAMACGLPVVATEVGGIPELVEPGVTGKLVPRGDVAALAGALEEMANDAPMRRGMGRAARSRALARFSKERMALELERIYEGLPGNAPAMAVGAASAALSGGER